MGHRASVETAFEPVNVNDFRLPGAAPRGAKKTTVIEGTRPYQGDTALCVAAGDEAEEE